MSKFFWDPEIESIPHSLDINPFRFVITHPTEEQFVEFNYNITLEDACDFIDYPADDEADTHNYKNIYNKYVKQYNNKENMRKEMYVIYNNSIINPETNQPKVLGGLCIQVLDSIFEDGNENKFVVMYVEYRCSFGKWKNLEPDMENLIKTTRQLTGNYKLKPNIGDLMSRYIDGMGRKFAFESVVRHCIIFNYALLTAMEYHLKQGWKKNANDIMSKIYVIDNGKLTKKTAVNIANKSRIGFVSGFQQMYKIV
jgi:hypothetical protein